MSDVGELKNREHKPINYSKACGGDDDDADFEPQEEEPSQRRSKKKDKDSKYGKCSANPSDQIKIRSFDDGAIIPELQHVNTAGLAFEKFFMGQGVCHVFSFSSDSGWKEKFGEGGLAGWSKRVSVDHLPPRFATDKRGRKGKFRKVFIHYIEERAA